MAQKRRHPLEKTRRWYPFEAHPPHLSVCSQWVFSVLLFVVLFFFSFCFALRLDFCLFFVLVFLVCAGGLAQWFGLGVLL